MNLPGLAPYARLIEEDANRRFGAYDEPLRDTFASEERLALQTLSTGVSIGERIMHRLYATQERHGPVSARRRVRWSHWKTAPDTPRQEWKATPSIG
jgi:hypothetical protein